jgi:UDP-4-amino-4,6-dideoxy-N-acetyl-beta-L-altrosamine N-acetyltransferase
MIIKKFGITFKRLEREDIELLRQWRNAPSISQFMEYREHITAEMQEEWFESVNNNNNLYFIIEYKGKKIGLINGKDIDWEKHSMETGVFFWDQDIYNTPVPILAVLILGELGVIIGGLTAYARILKSNTRAIRYNKLIGFELCEGQEEVENQLYVMSRENYKKKAEKLLKAYQSVTGKSRIHLNLELKDYESGIAQLVEKSIDPAIIKNVVQTGEGKIYQY